MRANDIFLAALDPELKQACIEKLDGMKTSDTGDLFTTLDLKKGTRVEISTNLETSDGLFNGSPGEVHSFSIKGEKVKTVNIKFEILEIGKKWMR